MSDQFENNLKKTLATAASRVDQTTRDELARRRRHLLDTVEESSSRRWLWIPVGGVAAALLAVLLAQPFFPSQLPDAAVADSGDVDMEILLAEEGLELFEDMEFYEWLDVIGDAG